MKDEKTNDKIENVISFVICAMFIYFAVANTVFLYRNPLCNEMIFAREFFSVMTFKKLPEYQIDNDI